MGTWGINLYEDDVTNDVKEEYINFLKEGKDNEEATKLVIDNWKAIDTEEIPIFWLALADTQWEYGRLLQNVKEQALKYINEGTDLARWTGDEKQYNKRRLILNELKNRLLSKQPTKKKIVIHKPYICDWKNGDVYAYKLESKLAEEKELYGKYFILIKDDEAKWHPNHIIPVVRAKITSSSTLPSTLCEINNLEYIQISVAKYEERYLPLSGDRPIKEQIEELDKIEYHVNKYGVLEKFLFKLIITSSKHITSEKLIYLGNFPKLMLPKNEFIPYQKKNISSINSKNLEEDLIDNYLGFNLKQFYN